MRRAPADSSRTGARRADLGGDFRLPDRSLLVVPADAPRPVEQGVGAVGVDVDLDLRFDEVRTQRAFWDLQFERTVGHAVVVADLAVCTSMGAFRIWVSAKPKVAASR